jgi:hypothetical protein
MRRTISVIVLTLAIVAFHATGSREAFRACTFFHTGKRLELPGLLDAVSFAGYFVSGLAKHPGVLVAALAVAVVALRPWRPSRTPSLPPPESTPPGTKTAS